MSEKSKIFIGFSECNVYLKAIGHITANQAFPLKEHFVNKIDSYPSNINVYFDLHELTYMDSTFIGLLVGLEKKLFNKFSVHLNIVNPPDIAINLFKNMGIDKILQKINFDFPKNLSLIEFDENIDINELEKAKMVLACHKELSSLNEENKNKFSELEKILEEQIKRYEK